MSVDLVRRETRLDELPRVDLVNALARQARQHVETELRVVERRDEREPLVAGAHQPVTDVQPSTTRREAPAPIADRRLRIAIPARLAADADQARRRVALGDQTDGALDECPLEFHERVVTVQWSSITASGSRANSACSRSASAGSSASGTRSLPRVP